MRDDDGGFACDDLEQVLPWFDSVCILVPYRGVGYFKKSKYRRAVRRKANFLTWTKKSQFRPKKAIVWAYFWPFSGYIGFSSPGSSKLAFLRTGRRYTQVLKRSKYDFYLPTSGILAVRLQTVTIGITLRSAKYTTLHSRHRQHYFLLERQSCSPS